MVYNKAFDELLPVIGNRVLKELQQYKKKQNKWTPLTSKKGKQLIPDKGVQHIDVRFRDLRYKDEIERSMLFKYINGMLEFYLNKRYESYIGKLQSAFIRQR